MKLALVAVALALACLVAAGIREWRAGHAALADGDAAIQAGRVTDAIASWEAAARHYVPFASHVDDAYERLLQLAKTDHRHALSAWRAVRSAAHATGGLWGTPHAADLEAADQAIAELASRDPDGAGAGGPNAAFRKAFHAAALAR